MNATPFDPARVALVRDPDATYPAPTPSEGDDAVRRLVDDALARLGGPPGNLLDGLVRPGDRVFIKPNMIAHGHRLRPDEWDYVITHGSVLRAVVHHVAIALNGRGIITLGDAPQTDSHWNLIVERMGLDTLVRDTRERHGIEVRLVDLRDEFWVEENGIYTDRVQLAGDPAGSCIFDLAARSYFAEFDAARPTYYGAFYDVEETNRQHSNGRHAYAVSRSPIDADVFINVPKLKTHKKCALTVNLKSLVGINANKNWLPHYRVGSPQEGGDQFERARVSAKLENSLVLRVKKRLLAGSPWIKALARRGKKIAYRIFGDTEEVVRSGNWHGNDTVWRMCLDLNRILLYGNPDGTLRDATRPKRFLSVVDGIIAMEGNGPVAGTRKPVGIIAAGTDPVSVDRVCAKLMGFDPEKIALIARAYDPIDPPLTPCPPDAVTVSSNQPDWNTPLHHWPRTAALDFAPHFGWTGAIEWATTPPPPPQSISD
jgi:uncharacterized protein (DUF362 family)